MPIVSRRLRHASAAAHAPNSLHNAKVARGTAMTPNSHALVPTPPLCAAPIDLASPVWDVRMKTALSRKESSIVAAIIATRRNAIVVEAFSIPLRGEHVQCFRDRAWLNDEVVNMFFELLRERGERYAAPAVAATTTGSATGSRAASTAAEKGAVTSKSAHVVPRCLFFSSFFFRQLACTVHGYTYTNVKRWTRRLKSPIFSAFDLVFIPLHVDSNHWVLVVIDMRSRLIQYWDSLPDGGDNHAAMARLQVGWVECMRVLQSLSPPSKTV